IEDDERTCAPRTLFVHRLGDELLAGAGLALDEDGVVESRNALEQREDEPHRNASAEQATKALPRRELELDDVGEHAHADRRVADDQGRVGARVGVAYPDPIERRSIAAPGIDDPDAGRFDAQGQVVSADGAVEEAEVHVPARTDADLMAGEVGCLPGVGAGYD